MPHFFASLRSVEIPVEPDAQEARQWLKDELARPIYHEEKNLLARFIEWIMKVLKLDIPDGIPAMEIPAQFLAIALILAMVLIIAILFITGIVRPNKRLNTGKDSAAIFDDARSRQDFLSAARLAQAQGNFDIAFIEYFRALVRLMDNYGWIQEMPGLTAREAMSTATAYAPEYGVDFMALAVVFDGVTYGSQSAKDSELLLCQQMDSVVNSRGAKSTNLSTTNRIPAGVV
ncbi:MAG: hypothetical protein Q4G30_04900 [Actinomycetaceae bacterium]|nr:hypothetical protein [Actinomycetaceae bacterium]